MTPWDHAHDEAHGIANAIGCAGVDDITRALLEVDEAEVERVAESAWRGHHDYDLRLWWRAGRWEREQWREAVRTVMYAQPKPRRPHKRPHHRRLQLVPKTPTVQYIAHHVDPPWAKRNNVMSLSQFEGTTAFKMRDEWR